MLVNMFTFTKQCLFVFVLKELTGRVGHRPGKNQLNFGASPDPGADTGLFKVIR